MKKQDTVDKRLFYSGDGHRGNHYGRDEAPPSLRFGAQKQQRAPSMRSTRSRGQSDNTPGAEELPPNQPRHYGTAACHDSADTNTTRPNHAERGMMMRPVREESFVPVPVQRRAQPTTIPGAEAVRGLDARSDEGTVFYRTADDDDSSDVLVSARAVDVDEESLMRRQLHEVEEHVLALQEQIHHHGVERNVAVAQVIGRNDEPMVGDDEPVRRELILDKRSCGPTGCRRITVVVVILTLVAVVSGVLVQRSDQASRTTTSGTTSTPVSTPPPPATQTTPAPQQDLIDFLSSASSDGGTAFQTPGTPQNQAFNWLAGNANLASYSDDRKLQRYTLATVYYYTGGDGWANTTSWLDDGDECWRWWQHNPPVLNCTESGAVQDLDLRSNNLQNNLPPELAFLAESLKSLDVGENSLIGQIPTEVGLLTNLASLHLEANELSGTIPSFLKQMTTLTELHLYDNDFTGSFECPDFITVCRVSCNHDEPECRSL